MGKFEIGIILIIIVVTLSIMTFEYALDESHICYKADDENKIITLANDSSIHFKAYE